MPEQNFTSDEVKTRKAAFLKKDLIISAIIGFLVALFILPIVKNLGLKIPFVIFSAILILALPSLSALGVFIAILLAQKIKVIYQLAKFVLVGALNTFIDWGMLNLLMFLTDIEKGTFYPVFKGSSFVIAAINSYFWNKFWTFRKFDEPPPAKSTAAEVLQFFVVSLVGFGINVGLATLVVNVWGPHFGFSDRIWASIGAFVGTIFGLGWNFLGYKLIVFKR